MSKVQSTQSLDLSSKTQSFKDSKEVQNIMLPKQHRLPGHKIPEILKTGRRFRGEIFDLILLPTLSLEPRTSSFTIIIPQRLSKKSTKRHRTKRLLVEAVHKLLPKIKPCYQIILMAKKILEKEKLQDIMPEVEEMLRKTGTKV